MTHPEPEKDAEESGGGWELWKNQPQDHNPHRPFSQCVWVPWRLYPSLSTPDPGKASLSQATARGLQVIDVLPGTYPVGPGPLIGCSVGDMQMVSMRA